MQAARRDIADVHAGTLTDVCGIAENLHIVRAILVGSSDRGLVSCYLLRSSGGGTIFNHDFKVLNRKGRRRTPCPCRSSAHSSFVTPFDHAGTKAQIREGGARQAAAQ